MALDSTHRNASTLPSTALAADANALGRLKMQAGSQSAASIQETAKQFESLFMRELLKSMREATMKSGMLDNPGSDLGTDLLDQQFAVAMSGQPGGLSEMIAQQLTRMAGGAEGAAASGSGAASPATPLFTPLPKPATTTISYTPTVGPTVGSTMAPAGGYSAPTAAQASFVQQHGQVANALERATGIPAGFMIGQAGHETGWGRKEIKGANGENSFNLFGIKAGAGWKGKVAEITTTEYVNGVAQKQTAKFRAYDSYQESFKDYARMLSESPRYAQVVQKADSVQAFASGLQQAGYATDPHYADKLSRAINTTLQLRRVQA